MSYEVVFERTAEKEFLRLPPLVRERIGAALARLAVDPFAAKNVKALKGGGHRLRVGDYRVLFKVLNDTLVVLVLRVAHRKDVYRD